ncbi:hypothetical protein GPECTOR_25g418 [Gonium pectorale]|uniref:Uncharacterized protein n=1 Tax=Gonium pectorale TaxID=33097 RepID=A0A150GGB8_GONPE|nr:hypothetical protein GPECTOR_25g418 [Gonium pectorale]|eukprot:KXZ48833.1 hypothetical protein GPECTOR_25g418 [Gonium pectorale]
MHPNTLRGLPPHLHQQWLQQQQLWQQQVLQQSRPGEFPGQRPAPLPPQGPLQHGLQQQQRQAAAAAGAAAAAQGAQPRKPLHGAVSGPPPSSPGTPHLGGGAAAAAAAAAAAHHRRTVSHDAYGRPTAAAAGLTSASPPMTPPTAPRSKGEGVANFLSGLKSKKEKLKSMVGGLVGDKDRPHGTASGGGGAGAGWESGPGGSVHGGRLPPPAEDSPGVGGRLRAQMMEKLQDGLHESRDKLSRIGKAIATKAPEALRDMKTKIRPGGGSGGGADPGDEWGGSAGGGGNISGSGVRGSAPALSSSTFLTGGGPLDAALLSDYVPAAGSGPQPGAPPAPAHAAAGVPASASEPDLARPSATSSAAPASAEAVPDDPDGDASLLGGFGEDFACRPSRKGVYVQLLGERVELLGERGTKVDAEGVPDTSIREIMLEVEVAATAVFEYHVTAGGAAAGARAAAGAAGGSGGGAGAGAGGVQGAAPGGAWVAPEPVSFNILQLEHRMRGNTIPLPKTLLKWGCESRGGGLLNAYMPGVLTRLLAGLLPGELGAYTAASGEAQALSGEFKVAGPSLSTTLTSIAPAPKPPSDPARRAKWSVVTAAAGRARAMLGLSDGAAAALSELFGGCGRPPLPPDSAAVSPSISGLCRFYATYSGSGLWPALVGLMDRALQDAFHFHGVAPAERFPLGSFLEGPVARLCRKPLRIAFSIERLSLALEADAALATVRDYCERLAREFEAKGSGRGGSAPADGSLPREPLEVQLELLDLWHASLARQLRSFKQRFRAAGATLLASADRRVFQFGAESVTYDGPLKLKLCVKKLALSLKLDEERIAELLSGGATNATTTATTTATSPPSSGPAAAPAAPATAPPPGSAAAGADIAGRLLGCYGDLFGASLDLGWRPESEADGAAQRACCMLSVASNDITRLRADVEGLWFQSSVSPRLAVRVLQAVVIALVLKFHAADSYSIRFWNRAFNQLHEYLSRGSLDVAVCLSVRAAVDRPTGRLRIELSGQDLNAPASSSAAAAGGDGLLGRVFPLYLLNDVNLMTVLDSVKLLTESAPPAGMQQQSGAV